MDIEDQFTLEHLLLSVRICRTCNKEKDLMSDFYMIRKDRVGYPSSYSYECKSCTITRVINSRKPKKSDRMWDYPDW